MDRLIFSIVALFAPTDQEVLSLQRSAPAYLTIETARDHLVAAKLNGWLYEVDYLLALSISWHESRYDDHQVTREPGGKVSCGVMTPIPTRSRSECALAISNLFHGYQIGMSHLRGWIDACHGNQRCALLGYAGGGALIRRCRRGPFYKHRHSGRIDICKTPEVFTGRARMIERLRLEYN